MNNPLLVLALIFTSAIAAWGIIDPQSLASIAAESVRIQFKSRAWFIMLTVTFILIVCIWIALSPYGKIKLGRDSDEPEFSTISWLTMLFSAGMGVGLLYWGTAEPLTHYLAMIDSGDEVRRAANSALFITNFHWGLHAWAIYAITGLIIAYFGFRLSCPSQIGAPILKVFGQGIVPRTVAWIADLLAIVAVAIGIGGSIAMGVFQIKDGVDAWLGFSGSGTSLTLTILFLLVIAYILPLTVDLSKGMARLSNTAMGIAGFLLVFILLAGPTHFIMGGTIEAAGEYIVGAIVHGFRTFTFMDERVENWFQDWTLTYMVWWLAWAPFVGVFIARISKGRTIQEFVLGVILGPTIFSIFWFGVFGSIGFHSALSVDRTILDLARDNAGAITFYVLEQLPFSSVTILGVIGAAFLFVITSVVSAAFVLGMFSSHGDINPSVRVKLAWGIILGALGLVMILSGSIDAVKSIIALGALPFVFVTLVLVVCFLKALKTEEIGENE